MQWLVLNPTRTQGDCARELAYTEPWLSTIINSDMFQAEYKSRCKEAGTIATHTIQSKLGGIAAKVLERIEEKLDEEGLNAPTERFLGDTANMALDKLGYGSAKNGKSVDVPGASIVVKGDLLIQAREEAREMKTIEMEEIVE